MLTLARGPPVTASLPGPDSRARVGFRRPADSSVTGLGKGLRSSTAPGAACRMFPFRSGKVVRPQASTPSPGPDRRGHTEAFVAADMRTPHICSADPLPSPLHAQPVLPAGPLPRCPVCSQLTTLLGASQSHPVGLSQDRPAEAVGLGAATPCLSPPHLSQAVALPPLRPSRRPWPQEVLPPTGLSMALLPQQPPA